MSSRPGGETDKFGARYEGRWTVRQLIYILLGAVDSITVEEVGSIGNGVEFRIHRNDGDEVHQVKRQFGNAKSWRVSKLRDEGVLRAAREHIESGREFHFVSMTPFPELATLANRARQSADLQVFVDEWLTKELRPVFDELSGDKTYGSADTAWQVLRGLTIHCIDELDLRDQNSAFAGLLLEGSAPSLAAVGLGDIVLENLGVTLDANKVDIALSRHGLTRAQLLGSPSIVQAVKSITENWKDRADQELLKPPIVRPESASIIELLDAEARLLLVSGDAGNGKSAGLYQSIGEIDSRGWHVLAFRLDRVEPFSSTVELGQRLGLDISPVSALAAISKDQPSLLVIDQLDAVSLASGRIPANFDAIADLLREARGFPAMRVLLACRGFDIENDPRIRILANHERTTRVEIPALDDQQVRTAVHSMGLDPDALTTKQQELLRSPFNLVLLHNIADEVEALSFGSGRDLLDAYWDRKRRDCRARRQPPAKFAEVIQVLVDAMSSRQQLAVTDSLLDGRDLLDDADVLASEHVVVRDGHRLAFFHETFFDYAFARQWINRGETLVEFLSSGEQELFRRGQVRQILAHLREDDQRRFAKEVEDLLTSAEIRFHIKHVVLAIVRALPAPTVDDWEIIEQIAATSPNYAVQLWASLKTTPWFDRLYNEGIFTRWLNTGFQDDESRAMEIMASVARQRSDQVASIIAPYAERERYPFWLRWTVRFGDVWQSRELFDLLLDAVRRGLYDEREKELWGDAYGLPPDRADWAVELLAAYIDERPRAYELNDSGSISGLHSTEHGVLEMVRRAAEGASEQFCVTLIPLMLQIMALTTYEDDDSLSPMDRHFSHRYPERNNHVGRFDQALLTGAVAALRNFVSRDSARVAPFLQALRADRHESAQFLLYEALRVNAERYAQTGVEVLLEGEHRFFSGYIENHVWAARELIQAIVPFLSDQQISALERSIVGLQRPADLHQRDYYRFALLAALDETKLSDPARRLLGELRRRFDRDQPVEPRGIVGGFFSSPVSREATQRMTDDQWLSAMNKYDQDAADFSTFRGGLHEFAGVVRESTAGDPVRFARLALRLTTNQHPEYGNAVLQGLRQTEVHIDTELVFDVIRHIASLGLHENDQSLAGPLVPILGVTISDDIIELILDRAMHSPDPTEEAWMKVAPGGKVYYNGDIYMNGFNTARGHCADMLGDLLIHDADGHRTSLVVGALAELASDPSVAVRSCVAHLLGCALRHARTQAVRAFELLVQTDDRLLATRPVVDLIGFIGNSDSDAILPAVERMLRSDFEDVRHWGGQFSAYCGLRFGFAHLLEEARRSEHDETRAGAAMACAQLLPTVPDLAMATDVLTEFFNDENDKVREAACQIAPVLRGQNLRPFEAVLANLISSASFGSALAQLLITLAQAPDRVDSLILSCVRRFIEVFGAEAGDISKAAAGESGEVSELLVRAYSQAVGREKRLEALGLIDDLLLSGAYDVDKWVESAQR